MHANDSAISPAAALGIRFTRKPASGWGGQLLAFRYAERQGLRELLGRALPDGRTSPNQIPVVTLALSLFATVLTGGRRFAHVERLREDDVVRRFIGAQRLPSAMTLTRYFGGFVRSQVEQLSAVLAEHTRARLARQPSDVLDLDSTVFERYGSQQGELEGPQPAQARPAVASSAARAAVALEARAAQLAQERQQRSVALDDARWTRVDRGLEVAETRYLPPSWKHSRRIVVGASGSVSGCHVP